MGKDLIHCFRVMLGVYQLHLVLLGTLFCLLLRTQQEHLEAANALKKQMWAEAQLDKRCMKEEDVIKQYSSFMGGKTETNVTGVATEGNHNPLLGVDSKGNGASLNPAAKQETSLDPHNAQNYFNNMSTDRNLLGQEFSTGQDNLQFQHGYAAEKSCSQLKSYTGHKAEEMYVYRSLPLGQDRRCNRNWQFATSSSKNDPGSGRIFLDSQNGCWRLIDSEELGAALSVEVDTDPHAITSARQNAALNQHRT